MPSPPTAPASGICSRRDRPGSERSGHRRDPDLASFTLVPWQPNLARFACDVTVEGEEWPYRPRTILRRVSHGHARRATSSRWARARVPQPAGGRVDRARRQARHAREALLRHHRPDAAVRLDDRLEVLQRARLGQLRERPRGCERPVRAELPLRRRPDTCDRAIFFRYMVHTLAEQRGMIATFMPKPFSTLTGNGCHFHMSLWKAGRTASSTRPTRVGSACPRPRTTSSAACASTHALTAP